MNTFETRLAPSVSRGRSRSRGLSAIFSSDDVTKSHRRTVHIIAIVECGLTSLVVVTLICMFIISLIGLWEPVRRTRLVDDNDFFRYVVLAIEAITVLAILSNICISVQLMHHTKPENERRDVLRRAEFWKCYNIFLAVLLPMQVASTFFYEYYGSGGIGLVYFIARVVFLVIVNRYIKELRNELTRIRPKRRPTRQSCTQTDFDLEATEDLEKRGSEDMQ